MFRPSQFFLNCPAAPGTSLTMSHLPSVQTPVVQSESLSHEGAAWHVPSSQSRPALHSVEFAQEAPQSAPPRAPSFFSPPQPGKSGGHSSFAAQRAGASPSSKDGGSSSTP